MGVILQVALPSRVLAAARLQCGAAGAGASRGLTTHVRITCSTHLNSLVGFAIGMRMAGSGRPPRASRRLVPC